MKKVLFVFATLLFVACGNKVAQPEVAEEEILYINLPEYKLLSTEEPRVSSNGSISPGQNLVYNIEIDHVLEKDSLELLQNYFIQKGETDFARYVNTWNSLCFSESSCRQERYYD